MKKTLFKKLVTLILILSGFSFFGQTIKGKVESAGMPLPGVNVAVKGTAIGTTTSFDGTFTLDKVPPKSKIVFSFIGFESKEIISEGKSILNVTLKEDIKTLNEVVVIGYGTAKRKDLTGAVSSVGAKSLKDQPFSSIDQALQGKVAGVTVTQNSGTPGGGVSLRIRGVTSLSGNEPLYVVDGVPLDGGANNDSFSFSATGGGSGQTKVSALSNINPGDVESIDILKDASASAIYGSRGSNGVVLITTKKGKKGKSTIVYESYTGFQQVTKYLDVFNLKEYAQFISDITSVKENVPFELQNPAILGEGTNWQKEIFRTAPISNHQLSFSGGKDNTKYYTSLNYFQQDGIVINSDFRRYSMRLNLETKVNEWFKVGNNLTFSNSSEHITLNDDESGVISGAVRQAPNIPVRLSDGTFGGPDPAAGQGSGNGKNPVATSEIKRNNLIRYKLNGNIYGEMTLAKGLTFRSDLGYDYSTAKNGIFNPTYKIGSDENLINESFKIQNDSFFWVFKNYFNYSQTFGKHSFVLLAGQEAQQSKYESLSASRRGFLSNDIDALNAGDLATARNDNYKGTESLSSYFGRINYSFADKYLLSASLRADSSSKFGANYRTGYFPSFSGAWVLSNESFMKAVAPVLNYAKIRIGYGEVGNQNIPNYAYGAGIASIVSAFGTAFAQANIQNPNVKWETLKSTNIGLELGFLSDAIRLDIDAYKKTSSDFLFPRPTPGVLGSYPSASYLGLQPPYENIGEIENKGIDLALNTRNIANGKFNWTTTAIFSTFKNKLIAFSDDNSAIFRTFEFNNTLTKTAVGQPIGQFYGFQVEGLYKSETDLNTSPTPQYAIGQQGGVWVGDIKFKDVNGDGKIDDSDRTYIGSPLPNFTYSLTNNLSYKNFDFAIVIQGTQGNEIYNWTRRLTEGMREVIGNHATVVKERFIEGVNENTTIPRFVNGDPNANSRVSDRFVEDGSYLRIQNITFGFSIPPSFLEKTKFFSKIRIYSTIQNLHTFTKYSGLDPEVGSYGQDALLTGVDNGRYPVSRTILMGVNLEF
jgi:TonB-linked SusC/RagA family outer membrane protein